jgi:manganese efflux pump family protein
VLAVVLVGVSLGLSNFGASVAIGIAGIDARTRLRIGVVFGLFETGMPILGLALGRGLARTLGHAGHRAGAALLVAMGAYAVIQSARSHRQGDGDHEGAGAMARHTGRLVLAGAALSIDNLAVGFALGTYHVGFLVAALVIGALSVGLSLAGLELGSRLGAKAGSRGEILGGIVLIGVGIAIAAGLL